MQGSVIIYSNGLVCCSVCAPESMTVEEVTAAVNAQNPTGIDHGWHLSDDKQFSGGEPMPCPCTTHPDRLHYLFEC